MVYWHALDYHGHKLACLSASSLAGLFLGSLFWGVVTDHFGGVRDMLVVSHVLSAVAVSCNFLPLVRDFFPALLGLTVLVSFLLAADFGVIDTLCLASTDSGDGEYGEMRAWNCLGCGLASAVLGVTIPFAAVGVFSIFYAFLLLQIPILFMFIVFLPNPRSDKVAASESDETLSLLKCLKSKESLFFLCDVFLYGLCISLPEVFGPIYYMEVLHGNSSLVGAAVLIMCLSEMLVFRFIEQILQKLGANYNMVRAACTFILAVRCVGYCLVPKPLPWIALFVESLHGITFGAMWFVTVKRADELAPDGARATMQSVASSTYFFFSFGVGSLLWGHCIQDSPEGIGWPKSLQLCACAVFAMFVWSFFMKSPTKSQSGFPKSKSKPTSRDE